MKTEWKFPWAEKKEFEKNRKENEETHDEFASKWRNNQEYLETPEILKKSLEEYNQIIEKFYGAGAEGYYYWLNQYLDENNLEIRAKFNSIEEFEKIQSNKINFFEIELGKISKEKQKEFLESKDLQDYNHFLKKVFENSKYMLTGREEEIMSLKSSAAYSMWVKMVSSLLIKETREVLDNDGNKKIKTYPEMMALMRGMNKEARTSSWKAFEDILEKYSEIAEYELNAILEDKKVNDKIRGFERPDFSRHLEDNINSKVVDALVNSVSKRFNISHKSHELKSKLLKQDKIGYHERAVEYSESNKEYSWEDSVEIVKKVFVNLDKKFLEIFEDFLENDKIDVFPKKGKRDGAFCVMWKNKFPVHVLLNHTNTLRDVTTIAHEFGHAINDEFMKTNQKALNIGSPKSIAEVASTFMEDFVFEELLKNANEEEKFDLLVKKIDEIVASVQRQIACYNFEKEIHETYRKEGYLSKEKIGEIFKKNMANYMGEFVDTSTCDNWWVYWWHIRDFFYVYSYASGILISMVLQEKVKENPEFIEKIKKFMETGTSKSPKDIFLDLGIDITKKEFWNKGLDKIEKMINETWELGKKLGKI